MGRHKGYALGAHTILGSGTSEIQRARHAWTGNARRDRRLQVEEKNGKLQLTPAWMSRDMDQAEPPAIGNGVVFAFGSGEKTTQAYAETGLRDSGKLRIAASTHATLYALNGETGKELYSSGDQIPTWNHFEELSIANGRVYLGTFDSVLYCFGLPNDTPTK